jgi:hypothetical protein
VVKTGLEIVFYPTGIFPADSGNPGGKSNAVRHQEEPMNEGDFESVAMAIEAREEARLRAAAKAELAEWRRDLERNVEIKTVEKILKSGGKYTGRAAPFILENYINDPHPLGAFLKKGRIEPGLVSRHLGEVRRDYERLQAIAGEGGEA